MSAALDRLTASITALSAKVDAHLASDSNNPDGATAAELGAAADAVDAITAKIPDVAPPAPPAPVEPPTA